MESPRRLNFFQTVWLTARLALRRMGNRLQSVRLRRKKTQPGVRTATLPKSRTRPLLSAFLLLMLGFNGFTMGERGLTGISGAARHISESPDVIVVGRSAMAQLKEYSDAWPEVERISDRIERVRYEETWNNYLNEVFEREAREGNYSDEGEEERVQKMRDTYARKGIEGFTARNIDLFNLSAQTWPRDAETTRIYLRAVNLIVLIWVPMMIFWSLGTNNKDLGQVEWSFEWLYTLPASARALYTSKVFEYAFLNALAWVLFLPFLILMFASGGHGLWSVPLGVVAMVYLSLVAGSVTTVLEVALRKFLGLGRLKNIQAIFTVLGTASLLCFYASTVSKPLTSFLVEKASVLPQAVLWTPFSLPSLLADPLASHTQVGLVAVGMVALVAVFLSAGLLGSEWLTRDGLVRAGGPYQGTRKQAGSGLRVHWLKGIAAHEMQLLARDRNLLVQVVIVPLMVPAYYLLVNTGMVRAVTGNFRNAATMAFAVGAYSFLNSGMQLLNRESGTLWYLLTFPQSLSTILRKKATVWATIGVIYGAGVLFSIAHFSKHLHGGAWSDIFLALYGIFLYAFIASGIGVLSTDVLQPDKSARFRADMVYLYMILAAMYANVIYTPSIWIKLAQLVLSTLMAYALWQKVKDVSPYLLDPVALPPRTISLADGMIAILAFFVLQALMLVGLHSISTVPMSEQITIAYTLSGVIVGTATLLILYWQNIPDVWAKMGFIADGGHQSTVVKTVVSATALGLVAAGVAFVYTRALTFFPEWQHWKQDAEFSSFLSHGDKPFWIIVLAVAAAPLFEEFLFRGLVFQGLRRSRGPVLAAFGSAALFALVHPPLAVIPVFGLGLAAAISFQRSRILMAPMITHAVYNACVILLNHR